MNFKQFLIDVINLNTAETIYRMKGFSEDGAHFWALYDQNMQKASPSLSPAERRAAMERLEKSRAHYNETMAALAERRRKLYEENPWLSEHNLEQPEALESVCAASGDIEAYIAERAKTDARYAAVQKEFQQIDASKAALEERRRKLYEGNPELYERTEKIRQEANQRREESKKKKD